MSEAAIAEETQAAAPATQASNVTEPVNDDLAEGLALLDEIDGKAATQDETRTEPETRSTEPEASEEELAAIKAAREAAAEEAAAKTREEIAHEQNEQNERNTRLAQLEGITQSFRTRAPNMRDVLGQVIPADSEFVVRGKVYTGAQIIDWTLNEFTEHHGQSALVANSDYWNGTLGYAKQVLPEAAANEIAKNSREGKYGTYKALMDAVIDAKVKDAQSGRYTEAQVKEQKALATLQALKKFQKDPDRYLSRTNTAASRNGTAIDGGDVAAKLLNPNTPIKELERLLGYS